MAFINFLGVAEFMKEPSGLWQGLLLGLFAGIENYGLRIVVFTLCLKLVLSPLDIFQRVTLKHNQRVTERIKPEMDKLNATYANDKQVLQAKQMELNKKSGYKYFSAFLPALIPIIIFLTLWPAITGISEFMTTRQYFQLYDVYAAEYSEYKLNNGYIIVDGQFVLDLEFDETDEGQIEKLRHINQVEADAIATAQNAVYTAYEEEYKEDFLWIKNVWMSDVPWSNSILEYEQFVSNIRTYAYNPENYGEGENGQVLDKLQLEQIISSYTKVTLKLTSDENNAVNGLLILPILAVLVSGSSQILITRQQRRSGQVTPAASGGMLKYMMYIMPVITGIFALMYSSIFTLYMITNSFITVVLNLSTTTVLNLIEKNSSTKAKVVSIKDDGIVRYGRPDPNAPKIEPQTKKGKKK